MKNKVKILFLIAALFLFVSSVNAATCDLKDAKGFCLVTDEKTHVEIKGIDYFGQKATQEPGTTFFKVSDKNELIYCSNVLLDTYQLDNGLDPIDYNCGYDANIEKSVVYLYEYGYGENKTSDYLYNSEYLTGDYLKDYYITQLAVWSFYPPTQSWLQEDWKKNWFNVGFGDFSSKKYYGETSDIATKASNLVNAAKNAATAQGSLKLSLSDKTMSITSDGKYYISEAITVTGKYLTKAISISVTGLNGAFVTKDKNATTGIETLSDGTESNISETIYVKVPVSDMTSTDANIKLTVKSETAFDNASKKIVECEPQTNEFAGENIDGETIYIAQSMIKYNPSYTQLSDEVTLTSKKYSVTISKKDSNGKQLSGATLVIKKDNEVIETWTTTDKAKAILLNPGIYTLSEIKAPAGYILNKDVITFTVTDSNTKPEEIDMINEPIIITISKKGINQDEELPGATLRITDKDGNTAKDIEGNDLEWITSDKPKSFHIAAGTYKLEEIKAPAGYILNKDVITFTVTDSNTKPEEINMINEPIIITISKKGINQDEELPGATLRITDKDGNTAKDMEGNKLEWITSDKSKSFRIAAGTYTLEEIKAPEGYELSDKKIEFTVHEDGTVTTKEGLIIKKEEIVEGNLIVFENTPEPEQEPTGSLVAYIAGTLCLLSLGVSIYFIVKRKEI